MKNVAWEQAPGTRTEGLSTQEDGAIHFPGIAELTDQLVNGITLGMLYILVALGLNIILGLMGVINFSHGAFFMLGAYVGYSSLNIVGNFWAALIIAPLLVGAFGAIFELGILRRLYRRDHSAFLMVTFGLTLIMGEAIRLIWGVNALEVPAPSALSGIVFILDEPFPIYRLFLAGAGIVVAIAMWQFLERTRLGLLIRATSQNAEMVHALGTDVHRVRAGVFALGCALAALGGVMAVPLVTAYLGLGVGVVVDAFVIVIIGGLGSMTGVFAGAIYLDSTGEAPFIRRVFEEFGPRARRRGAALLTAFGLDYVPGNLAGALALRQAGERAHRVHIGYFMTGTGGGQAFSRGTLDSLRENLLEPGYTWHDGALRTEPPGVRVRSFEVAGRLRPALSIGASEHFALPRLAPDLRVVDVYLGVGPPTGAAHLFLSRVAPVLISIDLSGTPVGLYVSVAAPPLEVIVQGTLELICRFTVKRWDPNTPNPVLPWEICRRPLERSMLTRGFVPE